MRKYLSLMLACLSCLLLSACGGGEDYTVTEQPRPSQSAVQDDEGTPSDLPVTKPVIPSVDSSVDASVFSEGSDVDTEPTAPELPPEETEPAVLPSDKPNGEPGENSRLSNDSEPPDTAKPSENTEPAGTEEPTENKPATNETVAPDPGKKDEEPPVPEKPIEDKPAETTSPKNPPHISGRYEIDGPSVTVPKEEETIGNLVWVPTKGGTKYHNNPGCSNMIDPIQVSVDTAVSNGYSACKRCH